MVDLLNRNLSYDGSVSLSFRHDPSRPRVGTSLVNLVVIGLPLVSRVTNLEDKEPFGVVVPDFTKLQDPFELSVRSCVPDVKNPLKVTTGPESRSPVSTVPWITLWSTPSVSSRTWWGGTWRRSYQVSLFSNPVVRLNTPG